MFGVGVAAVEGGGLSVKCVSNFWTRPLLISFNLTPSHWPLGTEAFPPEWTPDVKPLKVIEAQQ